MKLKILPLLLLLLASCSQVVATSSSEEERVEIINSSLISKADECEYNYDPTKCIMEEKDTYNYFSSELSNIKDYLERPGIERVYRVSGGLPDGASGDTWTDWVNFFLWEDGICSGILGNSKIKGYWFNSKAGSNEVNMLVIKYYDKSEQEVTFLPTEDPLVYEGTVKYSPSHGTRYIDAKAFYYYPVIGLAVDSNKKVEIPLETKIGDAVKFFHVYYVLKNLSYYEDYLPVNLAYRFSDPTIFYGSNSRLNRTGEFEIIFSYEEYEVRAAFTAVESN